MAAAIVALLAVDTAISGWLLARVGRMQGEIAAYQALVHDLTDTVADVEHTIGLLSRVTDSE